MSVTLEQEEKIKKELFLRLLNSPEELRDWISAYLGIDLPFSNISGLTEDSQSDVMFLSPGQAIWEAYKTYKEDSYIENPGYIWMASRDGAKTLSGSILNVLLICHFKAEIAHLAAVKKQAEKCLEYTNTFIRKIKPYLEHHGRKVVSDSKSKIQILNEDGSISYIDVIVATLAGGNSQRSTVGSYDELDTLSKQGLVGYREAKLIPTRKNNRGPLRIKYSTRKFVFGVFEKEIQERHTSGEKLIQWNILDIVEKCEDKRSLESLGEKHTRFVKKKLPLQLYTEEDVQNMGHSERLEVKEITLHKGCLSCPIAPVCQSHLAKKQEYEKSGFGSVYKSIDFAIGQFRQVSSEMAEAQLLCWKPTSAGLVYPKFSESLGDNVMTIDQAYNYITGENAVSVKMEELVAKLHELGADFYAGVDFGFTNHSVIVIFAKLSTGQSFVLDTFSQPGLEAHEFAEIALTYQQKYRIDKWFCDQASPATIKTFKKKGMKCPEFSKDVQAGIDAIRSQIVTASGVRLLRVIKTPENELIITMFKEHHFLLDAGGNVTKNPDDTAGVADIGDATRYVGQNVFSVRGAKPVIGGNPDPVRGIKQAAALSPSVAEVANQINNELMKKEIHDRASEPSSHTQNDDNIKKKKVFWDMS